MPESERQLKLNESEASLAHHALKFYMSAKGGEISMNTRRLNDKLNDFLNDTTFVVTQVENPASILGARGGVIGGASTSDAKKAAAAANGAKGGRPRKPNLYIRFAKSVWTEPDPKLLNELYKLAGTNTWLPDEQENVNQGPYVRMVVPEVSAKLEKLLSNSLNVFEWDEKPIYTVCLEHKNDLCSALNEKGSDAALCLICRNPAKWIY